MIRRSDKERIRRKKRRRSQKQIKKWFCCELLFFVLIKFNLKDVAIILNFDLKYLGIFVDAIYFSFNSNKVSAFKTSYEGVN
jgi:hypothetical protein